MYRITIRKGKEKQLLRHHPWVFTGAIEKAEPKFRDADWAEAYTDDGLFIARGWYDEKSHIVLHLLSWSFTETLGEDWIKGKVKEAVMRRKAYFSSETNAFRLIHGEADFLPGIAADTYARAIRVVVSSRFSNFFIAPICEALDEILHPEIIIVNADPQYASSEGISTKTRYFKDGKETRVDEGKLENALVFENGIYYEVPMTKGQKSGFYCDQRDNRVKIEKYAEGRTCLDVCSYTGAFTMHMLKGGAKSVKSIDASESALRHLLYQIHLNENKGTLPEGSREKVEILSADCFDEMRRTEEDRYDLIVLDPPKLAKTKGQLENAMKAYKDLNRVAMMKIKDGGIIATFSCSGAMTREDFKLMLSWSAKDANVEVQILETLGAGSDHPVRLSFPESEYLKGYILKVIK